MNEQTQAAVFYSGALVIVTNSKQLKVFTAQLDNEGRVFSSATAWVATLDGPSLADIPDILYNARNTSSDMCHEHVTEEWLMAFDCMNAQAGVRVAQ